MPNLLRPTLISICIFCLRQGLQNSLSSHLPSPAPSVKLPTYSSLQLHEILVLDYHTYTHMHYYYCKMLKILFTHLLFPYISLYLRKFIPIFLRILPLTVLSGFLTFLSFRSFYISCAMMAFPGFDPGKLPEPVQINHLMRNLKV